CAKGGDYGYYYGAEYLQFW
nr:immunoglobulin heavy chain junction region [Macaca mulatta]MOV87222.1 immunoglobulin heavy chain junction region [Macaca mulatta]MOV89127.1 immunoglobulin heavy chain junction region [Macaca mulatta]MOV92142.1 immunoglobulin heavy chain junction region [Macaca mulatta]